MPLSRDEERETRLWLGIDILMVVLILVNLALIAFDALFGIPWVQSLFARFAPGFHALYYNNVHVNFFQIDLVFVAIFVTEVIVHWAAAVYRGIYSRWYYYPFIHWYDVLGSLPISWLRVLRVLRVIAMTYRLQRLGLVDITKTGLYRFASRWVDILLEEISDRVLLKILNGVQREIQRGGPVADRIRDEAIEPHRQALSRWMARSFHETTAQTYRAYQPEVRRYVDEVIQEAIQNNDEIRLLEQIPVFGKTLRRTLERVISDIVHSVVIRGLEDLTSEETNELIAHVSARSTEAFLASEDHEFQESLMSIVNTTLNIIRDHLEIRRWRFEDIREAYEARGYVERQP